MLRILPPYTLGHSCSLKHKRERAHVQSSIFFVGLLQKHNGLDYAYVLTLCNSANDDVAHFPFLFFLSILSLAATAHSNCSPVDINVHFYGIVTVRPFPLKDSIQVV